MYNEDCNKYTTRYVAKSSFNCRLHFQQNVHALQQLENLIQNSYKYASKFDTFESIWLQNLHLN